MLERYRVGHVRVADRLAVAEQCLHGVAAFDGHAPEQRRVGTWFEDAEAEPTRGAQRLAPFERDVAVRWRGFHRERIPLAVAERAGAKLHLPGTLSIDPQRRGQRPA